MQRRTGSPGGAAVSDAAVVGRSPAREPVRVAERRRAVGLFGVSAAHGVNHIYATILPLVYPILIKEFHFSYSVLGLIIAASNLAGGMLQALFGYLHRRISARTLLAWENIVLSLLAAAMAAMGNVWQFAALRWAGAVAASPQHPVGSAYCAEEYPAERRGFALSAHVAGGNVGTLVVPLLGAVCIDQFGWRPTLLLFAVPIGVVGVLTFFLLRPEHELAEHRPSLSDAGLRVELSRMLRRRTVLLILLAATIAAGGRGLGVIATYVPAYLKDGLHFSQYRTGLLYNILLVGSVVGTLAAGRLSDLFGRKPVLIAAYSLALIAVVLLVLTGSNVALLFPVMLFLGVTAYAETSILQSFFADAVGDGSQRIGFGLFFTVGYGIGALWAAVIGAVVDNFGFHAAFIIMGMTYLAAGAILLPARDTAGRLRHVRGRRADL